MEGCREESSHVGEKNRRMTRLFSPQLTTDVLSLRGVSAAASTHLQDATPIPALLAPDTPEAAATLRRRVGYSPSVATRADTIPLSMLPSRTLSRYIVYIRLIVSAVVKYRMYVFYKNVCTT